MKLQVLYILTIAVVFAVAGALPTRADTITLDVSGTLGANAPATCTPSCTLGGDIVINNTTGAIISEDITVSGESPLVGPFTTNVGISDGKIGLTALGIEDSSGDFLNLVFPSPGTGSLVGYVGGSLIAGTNIFLASNPSGPNSWFLISGEFTPVTTTTPEPASLALLGTGLLVLPLLRHRRKKQLVG